MSRDRHALAAKQVEIFADIGPGMFPVALLSDLAVQVLRVEAWVNRKERRDLRLLIPRSILRRDDQMSDSGFPATGAGPLLEPSEVIE